MIEQSFIERFNAKWEIDTETGCWNWTASLAGKGYGQIKKPKERKQYYAHRLSYEIHKGDIPVGIEVCHTCDNPKCVNPDHLFLGTRKDNLQDMKQKNRHLCGVKNSQHKLSEDDVRAIKRLKGLFTETKIGKMFDIAQMTVNRIHRGLRWSHIT